MILLAAEFDLKALRTWEWQGMRQQIAQVGEALSLTVIDVVHFYFISLNILVNILSGNRICLCLPIPLPLSTK